MRGQHAASNRLILKRAPSEYLRGAALDEARETVGQGAARRVHRHRWITDAPLRAGAGALRVDRLKIEIAKTDGKATPRNGFVADLDIARDAISDPAARGRGRWKVENETFNVLTIHGHNLEHKFSHGYETWPARRSRSTCRLSPCTPPAA